MRFVHLASQYKSNILSITLSLICVPFSLGLICKCWILLIKTYRVLNRLSKCANMRYRKNQVFLWPYQWFTIKTKKIQRTILKTITNKNLLTRFHRGKICISQMYVHNLEKNRKNSFCIGVNNFANLEVSKLHGHLY